VHGLDAIPSKVRIDTTLPAPIGLPVCGELGRDDHLVPNPTGRKPFPNPNLGFFVLIVGRSVDEIAAFVEKVVHDLKGRFFATLADVGFLERVGSGSIWPGREQTYHAVPKFMAPRHMGLTGTEAEGLRTRCHSSRDLGGGERGAYEDGVEGCLDMAVLDGKLANKADR
jgi:hypothetical protein